MCDLVPGVRAAEPSASGICLQARFRTKGGPMRPLTSCLALFGVALAPLLVGCTQEVVDAPAHTIAPAWTGSLGNRVGRCVGGTMTMFLEESDDGWEGTAYYESNDLRGDRYRA